MSACRTLTWVAALAMLLAQPLAPTAAVAAGGGGHGGGRGGGGFGGGVGGGGFGGGRGFGGGVRVRGGAAERGLASSFAGAAIGRRAGRSAPGGLAVGPAGARTSPGARSPKALRSAARRNLRRLATRERRLRTSRCDRNLFERYNAPFSCNADTAYGNYR